MDQLNLFKEDSVIAKEKREASIYKALLEFHRNHSMANGEFYNTLHDLDLPSFPIKTGHFGRAVEGISICRIPPAWYYGPVIFNLAPSTELLREYEGKEVTVREFCKRYYKEVLEGLDPHAVYKRLESYGFPTLLCWEKTGVFCHRHLVQEWLCLNLLKSGEIKVQS